MAEDQHNPEKRSSLAKIGDYAQLAVVFPAATIIGWLIGVGLDKLLHTNWLFIVGLLVGIAGGFAELVRTATKKG
jgi:F0F1-type ATP synthase assembly protein I